MTSAAQTATNNRQLVSSAGGHLVQRLKWLSTSLKARVVQSQAEHTCFVGTSFHHLRTTKTHVVFSSLAQAFSSEGEGFALRGEALPWDAEDRRPHLGEQQAHDLLRKVIQGVRDASSCGYPMEPPAEADERAGGLVDIPDPVQQPAPAAQRPSVGQLPD